MFISLQPVIDRTVIETQAKIDLNEKEISKYEDEKDVPETLKQELNQAIKDNEDSSRFQLLIWILYVIVNVIGLGVSANLYSKAITDVPATREYYEIPIELYERMDSLEAKQTTTQILIVVLILLVILQWIFSS